MVGEVRPYENNHLGGVGTFKCSKVADQNQATQAIQRWPCFDGGASHATTIPPINYRTDIRKYCYSLFAAYQEYDQDYDADPNEVARHSFDNYSVSWGFKSRHPGGAQFLMADGSVHFLAEEINHDLYQLLGCRHDGKHIEEIP